MKTLRVKLFGFLLVAIAFALAGCTFFGIPVGQDRVEAQTLEQEIADYRDWQTPSWLDGYQETEHPVPTYVRYYVNDIGMEDIDELAPGSIIVKEQYDADRELINLTVMKRIEGYNPEHGDWFWAIVDTDGEWENAGRLNSWWVSECIDCHSRPDSGGDYVWVND